MQPNLRAGDIRPIYIREKENIDDRSVIRIRKTIQKQLSGYKARVKHLLHCNGVEIPERFARPGTHWSRAFIKWLKEDVVLLSSSRLSLDLLVKQVETIRQTLLDATKSIRMLAQTDRYRNNYELLMSIPGIGVSVAMCILTEEYTKELRVLYNAIAKAADDEIVIADGEVYVETIKEKTMQYSYDTKNYVVGLINNNED